MTNRSKEIWVGFLALLSIGLMLVFGWLLGFIGPWQNENRYLVTYGFAGGVEVGSPVRVSGVKVGKVEKIEFLPTATGNDPTATLRVTISVSTKAAPSVRDDSRFYVNMAGIIGERYIEITPGTQSRPVLASGVTVRGVDPPRIDQLLSQGYGVFGRVEKLLEDNGEAVNEFLNELDRLLKDANKVLRSADRKKIFTLIENLNELSVEARQLTKGLNDPESKEIYRMLFDLVRRAHDIDKPALKKFLQEEGVRARIF